MLFNRNFYKQEFITMDKSIRAFVELKNAEPNKYQIMFKKDNEIWTEGESLITFNDWTKIVDNNLKIGSYNIYNSPINDYDYKNILSGSKKKECYGFITNFEGFFPNRENKDIDTYLTFKSLFEELVEYSLSLEDEDIQQSWEKDNIKGCYIDYLNKNFIVNDIWNNLKNNEILPIILDTNSDVVAYVAKNDVALDNSFIENYINTSSVTNKNFICEFDVKEPLNLKKTLLKDFKDNYYNNSILDKNEELDMDF